MADTIVQVKGIKKDFAGVHALQSVDLDIKKGEIHCLAGENGSGKSTLIQIISGVLEMNAGSLYINGQHFPRISPIEAISQGIQVIYQDLSVFPNLTVKENLAYNSEIARKRKFVSWSRIKKIATEALELIDFKIDLDAKVFDLSIADKQLIAISKALLNDAKLIIMDEPTTALTRREIDHLFRVIKKLQKKEISILFVSHKLDEVFEISDRFTILRNGKNVITSDTSELDNKSFTFYMTGRRFEESRFKYKQLGDTPMLTVEKLSLKNGFSDVSFQLYRGEILGITGMLGSGRTELALALCGYYKTTSGTIQVEGRKGKRLKSIHDATKSNIGYVPEDRLSEGLFMPRSIGRNIVLPKLKTHANALGFLRKRDVSEEVRKWVERLEIKTPNPENPVKTLSGGNQQRVVLAKWLSIHPELLILNGPTVGVDIGSKFDIHEIIKDLAGKGIGIIVISDDLPEILSVCNRVLVMKAGRITAEYQSDDLDISQLTAEMTN